MRSTALGLSRAAAGALRASRILLFEVADVRQRIMLERKRRELARSPPSTSLVSSSSSMVHGMDGDTLSDDAALAAKCGLLPPETFNIAELRQNKVALERMVQDQRARRLAKKAAFEAWQEGQREKGQAHRLARQAKKAEKWKRQHYNKTHHRLVTTEVLSSSAPPSASSVISTPVAGRGTPNDAMMHKSGRGKDSISTRQTDNDDSAARRLLRLHATREMRNCSELLNVGSLHRKGVPVEHRVFLTVSRGMFS